MVTRALLLLVAMVGVVRAEREPPVDLGAPVAGARWTQPTTIKPGNMPAVLGGRLEIGAPPLATLDLDTAAHARMVFDSGRHRFAIEIWDLGPGELDDVMQADLRAHAELAGARPAKAIERSGLRIIAVAPRETYVAANLIHAVYAHAADGTNALVAFYVNKPGMTRAADWRWLARSIVEMTLAAPTPAPRSAFAIGGGEPDAHTHVAFDAPKHLVAASVHVVVDRTAPAGLNFFALQVDFDNATWAHGGVQDVDGDKAARVRQVNWGGLVDRGGGNADYEQENDRADLDKIQNAPAGKQLGPYAWKTGVEYVYTVERGAQVTLPAGDYRLIPDRPLVHVDHPRKMWEWRFTVAPVVGRDAPFVAVLYDAAASFTGFSVWNESGYGSTDKAQHTSWSEPRYTEAGATTAQPPTHWERL